MALLPLCCLNAEKCLPAKRYIDDSHINSGNLFRGKMFFDEVMEYPITIQDTLQAIGTLCIRIRFSSISGQSPSSGRILPLQMIGMYIRVNNILASVGMLRL